MDFRVAYRTGDRQTVDHAKENGDSLLPEVRTAVLRNRVDRRIAVARQMAIRTGSVRAHYMVARNYSAAEGSPKNSAVVRDQVSRNH